MTDDVSTSRWDRLAIRIATMQTVLALIGILTGLAALYAAMTQADASRRQVQASVWPALQIGVKAESQIIGGRVVRLVAENAGIGPARIISARLAVGGKAATDWRTVVQSATSAPEVAFDTSYLVGRILKAGETINLISLEGEPAAEFFQGVYSPQSSTPITWEVCYCSVFDECWLTASKKQPGNEIQTAVKSCPDYKDEAFQG